MTTMTKDLERGDFQPIEIILGRAFQQVRFNLIAAWSGVEGFRRFETDKGAIDYASHLLRIGYHPEQITLGLEIYIEANSQDKYAKAM